MKRVSFSRRLAFVLANHAERTLPAGRAAWGAAMMSETHHIDGDWAAFRWSLGCALASYSERIRSMTPSKLDVPRWLLGAEILVCLGPLTLLWIVAVCIAFAADSAPADLVVPTLIGTLGPIALVLALLAIASRRPISPSPFKVLAAAFGILAAVQIARIGTPWFEFEWRVLMLNSVLPGVVCAHLAFVRGPAPESRSA